MNKIDYQALRAAAEEEIMCRQASDTSDNWQDLATPEAVIALVDELAATKRRVTVLEGMNAASAKYAKKMADSRDKLRNRVSELEASHRKLRDVLATIHNTIRMDGGYTPLAAILNAAKRAHEESAIAAGVAVEGE
ncbi:ead/Ea22-like family protein [Escherichia coli]|uniref:ead/Ea22-like family protein n=1 Tax=Escherichia coli TaxID=562 RepID=UPI0034C5D206